VVSTSPDISSVAALRALWPATFPDLKLTSPKLLQAGEENDTWRVRGVVVKFPKTELAAAKLQREVELHDELVNRIGLLIPAVVSVGKTSASYPWQAVAFEQPRGRPGQGSDGPMIRPKPWARNALVKQMAEVLTKLHTMPVKKARTAGIRPRPVILDPVVDVSEKAIAWARKIAGNAVDTFLIDPIPLDARTPGKAVVCHADLKGEHIFVSEDGTRITALIDWADMAIADPAVDLAGLTIWLGPTFVREVVKAYGGPMDAGTAERAIFLGRAGLLHYCDGVLEGSEHGPREIIDPQLAAAFSG
jgi:aminoglycoside phosphotransferase (APT) family kinase protein